MKPRYPPGWERNDLLVRKLPSGCATTPSPPPPPHTHTRVAPWIGTAKTRRLIKGRTNSGPRTVLPIRKRSGKSCYSLTQTFILKLCKVYGIIICEHAYNEYYWQTLTTNISKNHSSEGGQQVIHILMYIERVRAYKRNFRIAAISMQKCKYLYLV